MVESEFGIIVCGRFGFATLVIAQKYLTFLQLYYEIKKVLVPRAVEPDPHGSAFIFPPGSRSLREKTQKNTRKIEENCSFNTKY